MDMGTNGEFALGLADGTYLAASAPLGPALEGVGLACGTLAEPGAAAGFALTPAGLEALRLPGGAESGTPGSPASTGQAVLIREDLCTAGGPRGQGKAPLENTPGITGTGYIALIARLLEIGVLDEAGRFQEGTTPLARRIAGRLQSVRGEVRLDLGGGLFLGARDVEEVQKVKAACDLAVSRLLAAAGLAPGDLAGIHLAGAMGSHAVPADLERLGFLPPGLARAARPAGNTSLAGASLALGPGGPALVEETAAQMRVLDLVSGTDFERDFVTRMRFAFGPAGEGV